MRWKKAVETCVIFFLVSKMDALIQRNENSRMHIEFCRVEIRNCVGVVHATTVRVDALEQGFEGPEAQVCVNNLIFGG